MKNKIAILRNSFLKPHEEIIKKHYKILYKKIKHDGYISNPILVDQNTMIILDGHHRYKVIQALGLTSSPVYFCQLQK